MNGSVYGVHRQERGQIVATPPPRAALSQQRIVTRAIELADLDGLDAVSMRTLGEALGVVPMALYKHVSNKDQLLDLMVDVLVAEMRLEQPASASWKAIARERLLYARSAMERHPWAWRAIETRETPSPVVLDHMETMIVTLRSGGLSAHLVHHVMHTLGSRLWGFAQEVFASSPPPTDPAQLASATAFMAQRWPHVLEVAGASSHDPGTVVGGGCDDAAEFAFAIDVILDGAEALHNSPSQEWALPDSNR